MRLFGTMRRIPEVFDCWFESGSMPYAAAHPSKIRIVEQITGIFVEIHRSNSTWFYYTAGPFEMLFDTIPLRMWSPLAIFCRRWPEDEQIKELPRPVAVATGGADALRFICFLHR